MRESQGHSTVTPQPNSGDVRILHLPLLNFLEQSTLSKVILEEKSQDYALSKQLKQKGVGGHPVTENRGPNTLPEEGVWRATVSSSQGKIGGGGMAMLT